MVMNDSSPHRIGSGIPNAHSAAVSMTATINPNTVDTIRYLRVPAEKAVRAVAMSGRICVTMDIREP